MCVFTYIGFVYTDVGFHRNSGFTDLLGCLETISIFLVFSFKESMNCCLTRVGENGFHRIAAMANSVYIIDIYIDLKL